MPLKTFDIDGITIGVAPIPDADDGRLTRRQRESAAVRGILDALLGTDVELTHDEHGAPRVSGSHISITHSARLAAVAVSADCRIGIDAEEWRDTLKRVKHKYLTAAELSALTDPADLLRAWTIKEAVYKAAGIPALPFTSIDTLPAPTAQDTASTSHPTTSRATATTPGGRRLAFAIHHIPLGSTLLTIAIPV